MNKNIFIVCLAFCLPLVAAAEKQNCAPLKSFASKRQDIKEDIERMAIDLDDNLTADPSIYDRLDKDISAIRASNPDLAKIHYFGHDDGKSLLISVVSMEDRDQLLNGKSSEWNCLNKRFNAVSVDAISSLSIHVSFGIFVNTKKAAQLYLSLPTVTGVSRNILIGDGSTICATVENNTWHYIFDIASGDCAAGCTEHRLFYYFTKVPGAFTDSAYWRYSSQTDMPEWADKYWKKASCRR